MKLADKHIIKTVNLSIGYTSKKEVKTITSNLNIDLDSGNLVCLLGENGVGKSTLLRTLTKVQPSLKGEIFINSNKLETINYTDFSKILSLVLTERLPDSSLTVFELVALGRQPYTNWIGYLTTEDLHIIESAFEKTSTTHLKDSKCYELSDGQLQKVLIARALAQNTPIIVLDEPTAHLDIHHTIETFTLLKQLAKDFNKTIIVSSHEINLALQLADELWLMTPNQFISGKTETLISNNSVQQLFESNLISFNKTLKQFTISNSQ
ncbi:MAG: ATP-binding cassette domain-containing protein [Lutibacter sp.]|uniref:ABC transporter ATP-binding protein n=1 Tax=Lutibacter sp. TaxID=1925666 RepID=UPI0019FDA68B|nr:ABC transporter ATP-binding protein [Lutibacter sp.]NOR28290.1 ATP-binding cassette domain-containing protein [Lutibacter sp.]